MTNIHGIPAELLTLLGNAAIGEGIREAVSRSPGGRFYRCALQVNPFDYGARHAAGSGYQSEAEYNDAMVSACLAAAIEVIAVTDHFRISSSATLIAAFEAAGIVVFPGFEANSSEGIHLLCLFEPGTSIADVEQHIGACTVADRKADSPQSTQTCEGLIELVTGLGGLCIAAHACSASGLLTTLKGQSRARAWKADNLLAAALPGPRDQVPEAMRGILNNTDPATERHQPICVVNANDVSDPADFANLSTTSLVKMTAISIEGLRQGFMDWESRVRLNTESSETEHTELVAISWAGGLFDGQGLRLNEGLNVLVGGRGAGKSTMIESIRYALDIAPKGQEAQRSHNSIVKGVLGPATSVSVLVRSPRPSPQYYLVSRIFGQQPVVRDQSGNVISATPVEVIGSFEVFGQHEISELTRQPDKLAEILRRFTNPSTGNSGERERMKERLRASRLAIEAAQAELSRIDDALAALPGLRENLRRFATAGLEEKLAEKTSIDLEARVFEAAVGAASDLSGAAEALLDSIEEASFLPSDDVHLPNRELLKSLDEVAGELTRARRKAANYLLAVSLRSEEKVAVIKAAWEVSEQAANERYAATVRELEADGHDPRRFVAIKNQVEALKPLETRRTEKAEELDTLTDERAGLLAEWEAFKARDIRDLEQAARKVSRRLDGKVRVTIEVNGDLGAVGQLLRDNVTGNINQALERLRMTEGLGLSDLANHIRNGAISLVGAYGFSQSGAEKIAQGGASLALLVEECELPAQADVELNVGTGQAPNWKKLDDLSTGQKATAVLLLLLLESDAPLIVDQPEDDLDNRFIADTIVPAMRVEKRRRQFIFSSHNANIPVLGDAEQIVGLSAVVDGGVERTLITEGLCGSIDVPAIKELVKDVLEGGRRAFNTRRSKYGF